MSYAHVGHDSIVGDNVTLSNNIVLGGHVVVGDSVVMGGCAGAHQFLIYIMVMSLFGKLPFDDDIARLSTICNRRKAQLDANSQDNDGWTKRVAGYTAMCKALPELTEAVSKMDMDKVEK